MEDYEYIGDLGSGSYGFVWKCLQRSSGRVVAVKGFKLAHKDKKFLDQAIREVRMLRAACDHPNVVQLLEAFRSSSGRVYMVFEFVERCLSAELHKRFTCGLPAGQTRMVLWQLLAAVAHLHSKKIVHRDIKPGNLLMTTDGVVKLCDFGFARTTRMEPYKADRFSSYVVTRWYRSPEMLVSDLYCAASDIWSLGCTFAELATGRPLFPGASSLDQLWRIMRCLGPLPPSQAERFAAAATAAGLPEAPPPPPRGKSLPQRLPELDPQLLDMVQACLRLDPEKRPTAAELMQMPYFWDVPKLIVGTPLQRLYEEIGGVAAMGHPAGGGGGGGTPPSGRAAAAPPAPRPQQPLPPATVAVVSAAATSGNGMSPRARRDVAAAAATGGGGGGSGTPAKGPMPRPPAPSVLLSAVAASLLGDVTADSAGGAVPLVSPRESHQPLSAQGSDAGEGNGGGGAAAGGGMESAPRSPASLSSAPTAGEAMLGGQKLQPPQEPQPAAEPTPPAQEQQQQQPAHVRDQLPDQEQASRKRRATATAVPAAAAAAAHIRSLDARAASAGGAVAGGRGPRGHHTALEEEDTPLSSDSILAGARGGPESATAEGTMPMAAVAPTGTSAASSVDQPADAADLHPAAEGNVGGRGAAGGRGVSVVEGPRSAGMVVDNATVSPSSLTGASGGLLARSRFGRAAKGATRDPRVGLGPGIGLLDDADDLTSSSEGHVSDDDELMEYFAARSRHGGGSGGAAAAAAPASSAGKLPKARSMGRSGHAGPSPPRRAGTGVGSFGSDHSGVLSGPRRGPSEGMYAGVQAVHHGLYGSSGSRQITSNGITGAAAAAGGGGAASTTGAAAAAGGGGAASTTGAVGRGANLRVTALRASSSFRRNQTASRTGSPSQLSPPPKLSIVGALPASSPEASGPLRSDTLPAVVPPPAAAAALAPPTVVAVQPLTVALHEQRAALDAGAFAAASASGASVASGGFTGEQLNPLSCGLPPLAGAFTTSVGYTMPSVFVESRSSLPAAGSLASGSLPRHMMSGSHARKGVSRQGSTVFNQLMYDALPEIGTPGGAPEAPVGTPPRRRAVMSGFTPCRAAAARAAAAGVPPAAAMAAVMGEAMRTGVDINVAFSPVAGRPDDLLSPDGGAEGEVRQPLRTRHSGSSATAAAAVAAARRYAQYPTVSRRHVSLVTGELEKYPPLSCSVAAGGSMLPPPYPLNGAAAAAAAGGGSGQRAQPCPYARHSALAAASDTGMVIGGSAPNTAGFLRLPRPPAVAASNPSAGAAGPAPSDPAGAVPIPASAQGRAYPALHNMLGAGSNGSSGGGAAGTLSPRAQLYAPSMTPAGRSRLASGNTAHVTSEASGSVSANPRCLTADEAIPSAEFDGLPWSHLGISPAATGGVLAPPPPATMALLSPHLHHLPNANIGPNGNLAPLPSGRARCPRWATSGLIDSLPEDREVNGDWRSSPGAGGGILPSAVSGDGTGEGAVLGAIHAIAVYSHDWAGAATDGAAAPAAAAAAGAEPRPLYFSDTPGGGAATSSGASSYVPIPVAGGGRSNNGGGAFGGVEGSRFGTVEATRPGPGGLPLAHASLRLRSGRSRPNLENGSAASGSPANASVGMASPDVPRVAHAAATAAAAAAFSANGSSRSGSSRWLPPVVLETAALSAPAPTTMPAAAAAAAAAAKESNGQGAGAAAAVGAAGEASKRSSRRDSGGNGGSGGAGAEAGGGRRSSGSGKWPRAKALLGGRLISTLVRKFKEQTGSGEK